MTNYTLLSPLLLATLLSSCDSKKESGFFASDHAWQPTTVISTERFVVHSPYSATNSPLLKLRLEILLSELSWLFECPDYEQLLFRLIPVESTNGQAGQPKDALEQVLAIMRSNRIVDGYFCTYQGKPCVVAYVPPTEPVSGIYYDSETMTHELTHFFVSQRQWDLPLWLDEGLASVTPELTWGDDEPMTATLPNNPPPIVYREDRDSTLWTTTELLGWKREGEPDTVDGHRESQLYSAARSRVYFLLEDASGPLRQRIESLRLLTENELREREEPWLAWVERHAKRSQR